MIAALPAAINHQGNASVLSFVQDLSAHSDVWDALWQVLKKLDGVETFCPDPTRYRYVVAYVGQRVFAFAVGMSNIYVRLDAQGRADALARGALDDDVPDGAWVYFRLWQSGQDSSAYAQFIQLAHRQARLP